MPKVFVKTPKKIIFGHSVNLWSQGVNIGLCPTKDFVERICCYDLPCRGLDLRESLRLAMSRNSTVKRSKRSLVHDNELPIMAQVDPMCGLRLGSDETQHISHRGSPLQSIRSPHSRIFRFVHISCPILRFSMWSN